MCSASVFQGQIANSFKYPQKNILRRTEAFMRDYYQHARNIFHLTEMLAERLCLSEIEAKRSGLLGLLPSRRKPVEHFDGFHSEDDMIYAESREIFTQDPYRLMRVFQHAQLRHLRLSPELQQIDRPAPAAGRPHVPILARGAGDFLGHPLAQGGCRAHPAHDAYGRFPGPLHPGIRRADLPRAARVFPPLHRG